MLVLGGAQDTPGAVLLAGEAALRAGAGKLMIGTTASTAAALAVAVPEAAVRGLPEQEGQIAPDAAELLDGPLTSCDAVLLGSGLGDVESAVALLARVVPRDRVCGRGRRPRLGLPDRATPTGCGTWVAGPSSR